MINEQQYAEGLNAIAEKARLSQNPQVRQLWNPKRTWSVDRLGGRVADAKNLRCRQAIIDTLRQHGPLSARQIYRQIPGFGYKRCQNAKDWLVTANKIVPLSEDDRRNRRYALLQEGNQ